jgi:hypothetical protein
MLWTQTPNHSALRRETFLALLRRKESPSSSLILLHVVQASKAKTMTGTSAQVWVKIDYTFTTEPIQYPLFFSGAGFYLDATNPKYALHYNMRTHIQFEIPQVIEIAGLPIVSSGICFSQLKLIMACRISNVCLYSAIAWVAMGHCVHTSRQKRNSTVPRRHLHLCQIPLMHRGDRKVSQDISKAEFRKRKNNMMQLS